MENFVVSARKYRPQNFDTVVGQKHITTTLKNAIRNEQLAHAFLFCGPRGVGKTTCARILAKTINCEHPTEDGEACGTCTACTTFQEGQSMSIHELDAASNNSVDNIRELNEHVRFAPQGTRYKVYIIDEVHMLSASAFNAFLKTLEEPPAHAIFILATTEKHKILPTILSRCQVFDFKRMPTSETVGHLKDICEKENVTCESDALHLIAQKSEGCMRDALSILDKIISFTGGKLTYKNTLEHLNILDYEYFFQVNDAVMSQDAGKALLIYDEILQKGFEGDDFLDGYSEFLRDLLVSKDKRAVHLMEVTDNLKARYEEQAGKLDTGFLVSALNILNETGIHYKQARNKRLSIEMSLIRLSYLQQAVSLINNEKTGAVSKKKVTERAEKTVPLTTGFSKGIKEAEKKNREKDADGSKQKTENKAKDTRKNQKEIGNRKEEIGDKEPRKKEKVVESYTTEKSKASEPESNSYHSGNEKESLFDSGNSLDLNKIRKKVTEEKEDKKGMEKAVKSPLEKEVMLQIWNQHIEELKKLDKRQAANLLGLADIRILDDQSVEIICRNQVQRSFIDDQKIPFAEKLKKRFHNYAIQVSTMVDDSLRETEDQEPVLTKRQQLDNMIKKYPLVKELKDRLNLDLG